MSEGPSPSARRVEHNSVCPPPHIAYQEILMAAEAGGEYFSYPFFTREERSG
jgi:hypothetical protein